eukprot:Cvel_7645.t1-p1 / transcript=Cvel_7645.t1 / gene=Cvel_7645 / organism=Chromera_velia_CCMP2878 / gene_product=hypothetical protein / transcript_product=hypothetical protein / location=Cvel_scaffold404:59933-62413(+) / protein_length=827 / sequence_SO=supercontig / SO=protein_coding / is_pseudo=false
MRISTVGFCPNCVSDDSQIAIDTSSGVSVVWDGQTLQSFVSHAESVGTDDDSSMPAAQCGGRSNARTLTLEVLENPLNPWTEHSFGSGGGEGGTMGPVVSVSFRKCGEAVSMENLHDPPIALTLPLPDQLIATGIQHNSAPEWELRDDGGVTFRWPVSSTKRTEQTIFCRFLNETVNVWDSHGITVTNVTWPSTWQSSSSITGRPTVTCACSHLTDFSLAASATVDIEEDDPNADTPPVSPTPGEEDREGASPSSQTPVGQEGPTEEVPPETTEGGEAGEGGGDPCAASVMNCPWFIPVIAAVGACLLIGGFLLWFCCFRKKKTQQKKKTVAATAPATEAVGEKTPLRDSRALFLDSRTDLGSKLPADTRSFLEGGGESLFARDSNAFLSLDASKGQVQLWADGGARLVWCTPAIAASEEEMRMEAEPATPVAAGLASPPSKGSDQMTEASDDFFGGCAVKPAEKENQNQPDEASPGSGSDLFDMALSGCQIKSADDENSEANDEREPMTTRNGKGRNALSLRFASPFGGGGSSGRSNSSNRGGETVRSRFRDVAAAVGDFTVKSLAAMTGRSSARKSPHPRGKFELYLTREGRLAVMLIPTQKGGRTGRNAAKNEASFLLAQAANQAAGGYYAVSSPAAVPTATTANRRVSFDEEFGKVIGSPQTRRAGALAELGATYVWRGPNPSEWRGVPVEGPFYAFIQQSTQQRPRGTPSETSGGGKKAASRQSSNATSRQGSSPSEMTAPEGDKNRDRDREGKSPAESEKDSDPEVVIALRATDEVVWTSSRGVLPAPSSSSTLDLGDGKRWIGAGLRHVSVGLARRDSRC